MLRAGGPTWAGFGAQRQGGRNRCPYQIEISQLRTVTPCDRLDFLDVQSVTLAAPMRPVEVYGVLSGWMAQRRRWAFRLRDALSAPFGMRRIGGFSGRMSKAATEGEKLDVILVEHASPTCWC